MLHFLRNIRQRLLTENRFIKYLLYAIGEILLVVIGILIALQIDNWNENVNRKTAEQKALNNLHLDFEYNLSELKEVIEHNNRNLEACMKILNYLNDQLSSKFETTADQEIARTRPPQNSSRD